MEKLEFKTLTTEDEIKVVLDKVEGYSGVRLPISYARQGTVVGVFLQNKLAACYMLVTSPSFRSLMFVPDSIKRSNKFFQNDNFEMMEVNGLWIGPALKTPRLQMKVWMRLIKDIFVSRKKYILLMRDNRNKSMERFLNMTIPKRLYEGVPLLMAGELTHAEIQVSYTTRWSVILNTHKYLIELRNRNRRAEKFAQQRSGSQQIQQTKLEYI